MRVPQHILLRLLEPHPEGRDFETIMLEALGRDWRARRPAVWWDALLSLEREGFVERNYGEGPATFMLTRRGSDCLFRTSLDLEAEEHPERVVALSALATLAGAGVVLWALWSFVL